MPGGKGGVSSEVTVHNGPVMVDADSTVEIKGLDNIKFTLEPTPLKTESKQELILPQPFKTETKLDTTSKIDTTSGITSDSKNAMSIDLKPVALDVCLNTSSTIPQGQICQPFSFHLGFTWFGMEMFGVNFGGESRVVMQELPKKPSIDWPAQQNAAPDGPSHAHHGDARVAGRCRRVRGHRSRPLARADSASASSKVRRCRSQPRKVALLRDAAKPLVLAGPPRDVRGELHIRNPGDEKIIVRQPFLRPVARGRPRQAGEGRAARRCRDDACAASSFGPDRRDTCRLRWRSTRPLRREPTTRSSTWTANSATSCCTSPRTRRS